MSIKALVNDWERHSRGRLSAKQFAVHLPIEDTAKLHALAEMYPRRNIEQIITDLLTAALEDFERNLPYRQGSRVIAEDDHGDPIYEDSGPTPRFLALSKKHHHRLQE